MRCLPTFFPADSFLSSWSHTVSLDHQTSFCENKEKHGHFFKSHLLRQLHILMWCRHDSNLRVHSVWKTGIWSHRHASQWVQSEGIHSEDVWGKTRWGAELSDDERFPSYLKISWVTLCFRLSFSYSILRQTLPRLPLQRGAQWGHAAVPTQIPQLHRN